MFEVVIAILIIAMVIIGIVSLSTFSLSNSLYTRNKTLAGKYSQEALEWLRSEREKDTTVFFNRAVTPSTFCLQDLVWTNTGNCASDEYVLNSSTHKREVILTPTVMSGKRIMEVIVTTSWSDSKGLHQTKSSTNFNDIRENE